MNASRRKRYGKKNMEVSWHVTMIINQTQGLDAMAASTVAGRVT